MFLEELKNIAYRLIKKLSLFFFKKVHSKRRNSVKSVPSRGKAVVKPEQETIRD